MPAFFVVGQGDCTLSSSAVPTLAAVAKNAQRSRPRWDKSRGAGGNVGDLRASGETDVHHDADPPPPPLAGGCAGNCHSVAGRCIHRGRRLARQPRWFLVLRPGRRRPADLRRAAVAGPLQRRAVVRAGVRRHAAVDVVGVGQQLLALGAAPGPDRGDRLRAVAAAADVGSPGVAQGLARHRRRAGAGVRGGLHPGLRATWCYRGTGRLPRADDQHRPGTHGRRAPATGRPPGGRRLGRLWSQQRGNAFLAAAADHPGQRGQA